MFFSKYFFIRFWIIFGEVFETLVILSGILFPIKSSVAFAVFWMNPFEEISIASVAACLAWSRIF